MTPFLKVDTILLSDCSWKYVTDCNGFYCQYRTIINNRISSNIHWNSCCCCCLFSALGAIPKQQTNKQTNKGKFQDIPLSSWLRRKSNTFKMEPFYATLKIEIKVNNNNNNNNLKTTFTNTYVWIITANHLSVRHLHMNTSKQTNKQTNK